MNSLIQRLRQPAAEQPIALHSQSDESSDDEETGVEDSADGSGSDQAPILEKRLTVASSAEQIVNPPLTTQAPPGVAKPAADHLTVAPTLMRQLARQGKPPALLPATGAMLRGVMSYTAVPYPPSRLVVGGRGKRVEPVAATATAILARNPLALTATAVSRSSSPRETTMKTAKGATAAPTTNFLVIGDPESGKSSFVNAFRAAVVRPRQVRLPLAPVGRCGLYGTTTVEPYPDNIDSPSWLCIDTPGLHYTGDTDEEGGCKDDDGGSARDVVLEKMIAGLPWRTQLVGRNALTMAALRAQPPVRLNRAHQCIIVVPATTLIRRRADDQPAPPGALLRQVVWSWWQRWMSGGPAYEVAPLIDGTLRSLRDQAGRVGELMHERPPFIVVTKMDCVGGSDALEARRAILTLLGCCVPRNQVFFVACPAAAFCRTRRSNPRWAEEGVEEEGGDAMVIVDPTSRAELVRLHSQLTLSVRWAHRLDAEDTPTVTPHSDKFPAVAEVKDDGDNLALYSVD